MKKCQSCGYMNEDIEHFCYHCGQLFYSNQNQTSSIVNLTINSTSKEIYDAMKLTYQNIISEITNRTEDYRDELKFASIKAPTTTFNYKERSYWAILERAELEILDIKLANDAAQYFLLSLLIPTTCDINLAEYKKAKYHFMTEVGDSIIHKTLLLLERHAMTIFDLKKEFVSSIAK